VRFGCEATNGLRLDARHREPRPATAPGRGLTVSTMFDIEDAKRRIPEFVDLYKHRPFKINEGGMKFNHSFATWYMLSTLSPNIVVESGVWKGHSTWLIEQCCPNAELFCLDLDYSRLQYRSSRAVYFQKDFSECDWSDVDTSRVVALFDDHQNAYSRLKDLYWSGMLRAIFDDNFPCGEGDAYSLRHVLSDSGYGGVRMKKKIRRGLKYYIKRKYVVEPVLRRAGPQQGVIVKPTSADRRNFLKRCLVYQEFPPVVREDLTSSGFPWNGNYAGEPPLLARPEWSPAIEKMLEEDPDPFGYGYITYVELKS
jgi:hypothetical protein